MQYHRRKKKARPDRTGFEHWPMCEAARESASIAACYVAASSAYFCFALITASATLFGVSA
jgi:hypothetical protein